eukprot:CAMPEP_0115874682 /NCGR_PEP_ID=MMETSP0287-20121206/24675_1 /TAXON_ID=412157 /ORGANISM="Chrysochromulina rotalis, Strain UIO044" /LENGTH=80 /DNA_ID=CAMNT_0003329857 /DNA_START=38 /DNA_END=276 /DNA_ORIENTATION=-
MTACAHPTRSNEGSPRERTASKSQQHATSTHAHTNGRGQTSSNEARAGELTPHRATHQACGKTVSAAGGSTRCSKAPAAG